MQIQTIVRIAIALTLPERKFRPLYIAVALTNVFL